MFFALILLAAVDGFVDVGGPPSDATFEPVSPIVFADEIHPLKKEAAIDESVEGCDFCAAREPGRSDKFDNVNATRPVPVRRFTPFRTLLRRCR